MGIRNQGEGKRKEIVNTYCKWKGCGLFTPEILISTTSLAPITKEFSLGLKSASVLAPESTFNNVGKLGGSYDCPFTFHLTPVLAAIFPPWTVNAKLKTLSTPPFTGRPGAPGSSSGTMATSWSLTPDALPFAVVGSWTGAPAYRRTPNMSAGLTENYRK